MRRNKRGSSFGVLLIFGLIIGGAIYLYNSSLFERDIPQVNMKNNGYWNLKNPLKIKIRDASGLKSYKVTLIRQNNQTVLNEEQFMVPKESVEFEIKPPNNAYAIKDKNLKIVVEAVDASKWNFFKGNAVIKEFDLKIDKRRPMLNVVTNSYKISKGGSAIVIFRATDDNMKSIYIKVGDRKFKAEPFYKQGYYISLLAWSVLDNGFRATVFAEDDAGNVSQSYIPLYLKQKTYKVSNIKVSDNFLKGKIAELAGEFQETQGVTNSLEQFKIVNEDVRAKNEALIHKITSKVSDKLISDFKIDPMYPLKNAQVVAHFGDHRKYYYDGKKISESYHLGLDLASNAMAKIIPQNSGEVVFTDFNGLYGNMPVINHGLGLYTIYGHCSKINVNRGDYIAKHTVIANTGKTGYAMGDHLHFGVVVQGVEVRPQEWMDKTWIKLNVTDVINTAKKIIDKS